MDGMDQLWLSAPGLALRLWPEGAPGWQLNPAGAAWSERRQLAASHWDALAARLRAELGTGSSQGHALIGRPTIELGWTAVPLTPGWLVWLDADAPEVERLTLRLDLAQNLGRMGVWERDLTSWEGRWDQHMFRMAGFDPAQGVPHFDAFMQRVHPEDQAGLLRDRVRFSAAAGLYETRYPKSGSQPERLSAAGSGTGAIEGTICWQM